MKRPLTMAVAASALLVFGAAGAQADCAAELAALSHQGIVKDGSTAPMGARGGASNEGAASGAQKVGEADQQRNRAEPSAQMGVSNQGDDASPAGAASSDSQQVGEADQQRNRAEPSAQMGASNREPAVRAGAASSDSQQVGEADPQRNRAQPSAQMSNQGLAKDGSTAPLQRQGQGDVGTAISAEDAENRQLSASEAEEGEYAAAVEKARTALERGDEEACMEAVEEAKAI